jgi:hypothetical protein
MGERPLRSLLVTWASGLLHERVDLSFEVIFAASSA